ncbi:Imm64 family immunity protein [Exiguobacterium sp. SH0S1]|uniref:Imm64 family immunity protein n=1 Tax=Exiguobacterium sp. SH0S1 TaxID=2510949 RepID=UPI0013764584|nr:Imm64 family immunity protein [Exiguobacterium sp. SH0S1]
MDQAGGFISIGMAYPSHYPLPKLSQNVCEELLSSGGEIINVTYSQDEAGNDWTTTTDIDYAHIGYYGSIHLRSNYFGGVDIVMTVSLQEMDTYVGILIDIKWNDVVSHPAAITEFTQLIERLLVDVYRHVPFSYAIAGHELELDWAPEAFPTSADWLDAFPLSMVPSPQGVAVTFGSISIDGITPQPKKKTSILFDS